MNAEVKKRPAIALTPVSSSQIHAIGHCPDTNTLAVQFKSGSGTGSTYHYENINSDQFAEFQKAESVGAHFGKMIKPHSDKHPYKKVG